MMNDCSYLRIYTGQSKLNHHLQSARVLPNSGSLSGHGERGNIELISFNLTSVILATDNFSAANKLGEGGFGVVYKVIFLTLEVIKSPLQISFNF